MKKEKGITMIVLVFTVIILLIIMGISFTVMTGDNGMMKKSTEASFKYDMSQIKELVDEKTTLFELEGVGEEDGNRLLTKSVRLSILQEYYNIDNPEESKMNLLYKKEEGVIIYYKASSFTEEEIEILNNCGAQKMTENEKFMYNE